MTARKYGKTDVVGILGVCLLLCKDPNLTFIIMSRNYTKASLIVSTIGQILRKWGVQGRFGKTEVWTREGSKQPNVMCLGMESSLKMYHCDYVIMDDPIDPEDERSAVALLNAYRRYEELEGAICKYLIIMSQPVVEGDLYDVLRNKENGVSKYEAWHGSLPSLDEDIESLRINKSERWIQKNYFGLLISNENNPFNNYSTVAYEGKYDTGFIDPSKEGDDYTAISVRIKTADGHIVKGIMLKLPFDMFIKAPEVVRLMQKTDKIYFENNIIGSLGVTLIKEATGNQKVYAKASTSNKIDDILKASVLVRNQRIQIEQSSNMDYLKNLETWSTIRGKNQVDDGVDSLARLFKACGTI